MKRLPHVLLCLSLLIVVIMTGCAATSSNPQPEPANTGAASEGAANSDQVEAAAEADPRADWPEELVYAVIPTEDQEAITRRNEPMADYLTERLGIPVKIYSGTDYNANIEAMRNNHVHIAYYGPFAYVLAKERANAEAFAVHLSSPDAEPSYTSAFITLEGNGIETYEDLANKSFAWADPTSASGYLFPRAHLINELGLTNDSIDSYFSNVVFSGSHESSVLSVLNGDVDAAAVSSGSGLRAMEKYADHRNGSKIFIFGETMDIPSAPYTYRADLPENLKEAIREAFYEALDEPSLEEFFIESKVLGGYVPVTDEHFEVIRQTASALGMSPEDLLQ